MKRNVFAFTPELKPPLLRGHSDAVNCIACKESKLFSGSVDRSIRVWDVESLECLIELGPSVNINFSVQHICLHENVLVSCGFTNRVVVIETHHYTLVKTLEQQEKFNRVR